MAPTSRDARSAAGERCPADFCVERVSEHITRIRDVARVAAYLVQGDERALLVDTCCGVGDLRGLVDELCPVPYDVLLTHGHVDHVGGVGAFADREVWIHPDDRALMMRQAAVGERLAYLDHVASRLGAPVAREPLVPAPTDRTTCDLADGMRFDLGHYPVEVWHVPGHTRGTCMLLFERERTALFGDACGENTLLVGDEAGTVEAYHRALGRVRAEAARFDRVLRSHGSCASDPSVLDEVLSSCQLVLAGRDDAQPAEGLPIACPDAYLAHARDPETHRRLDGGAGNLVYRRSRIFS